MKKKVKLKGALRIYLSWPLIVIPLLFIMSIGIACMDSRAGLMALIFATLYGIGVLLIYFIQRPKVVSDLVRFASDYGHVHKRLMQHPTDLGFASMARALQPVLEKILEAL